MARETHPTAVELLSVLEATEEEWVLNSPPINSNALPSNTGSEHWQAAP